MQCGGTIRLGATQEQSRTAKEELVGQPQSGERLLAAAAGASRSRARAVAVNGVEAAVEGAHVGGVHLAAGVDKHVHLGVGNGSLHGLRCQRQGGRRGRDGAQADAAAALAPEIGAQADLQGGWRQGADNELTRADGAAASTTPRARAVAA